MVAAFAETHDPRRTARAKGLADLRSSRFDRRAFQSVELFRLDDPLHPGKATRE